MVSRETAVTKVRAGKTKEGSRVKKVLFVVLAVMLMGSVCYAQDTTVAEDAKTAVGKVVEVTVADPAKGVANETIVVVDEVGKSTKFTVDSATSIVDATLNAVTLGQLNKDKKVEVKYSEAAGTAKAEEIKVVE